MQHQYSSHSESYCCEQRLTVPFDPEIQVQVRWISKSGGSLPENIVYVHDNGEISLIG